MARAYLDTMKEKLIANDVEDLLADNETGDNAYKVTNAMSIKYLSRKRGNRRGMAWADSIGPSRQDEECIGM